MGSAMFLYAVTCFRVITIPEDISGQSELLAVKIPINPILLNCDLVYRLISVEEPAADRTTIIEVEGDTT
jgi:hypothetical protein